LTQLDTFRLTNGVFQKVKITFPDSEKSFSSFLTPTNCRLFDF
jgi:hypothetical protein